MSERAWLFRRANKAKDFKFRVPDTLWTNAQVGKWWKQNGDTPYDPYQLAKGAPFTANVLYDEERVKERRNLDQEMNRIIDRLNKVEKRYRER